MSAAVRIVSPSVPTLRTPNTTTPPGGLSRAPRPNFPPLGRPRRPIPRGRGCGILPCLLDDIHDLIHAGKYEPALQTAKRLSIDLLKQGKPGKAATALAAAGRALCLLNSLAKARGFAQEAYDLSARDLDTLAAGYALAVGALAQIRLAEFEPAEGLLDKALDALHRHPKEEVTAFARLVSAELSIAREDYVEARVFAQDATETGNALNLGWIKARAGLVRAICEERAGDVDAAIEGLNQAEQDLKAHPDAETLWLVRSAMAGACAKSGRDKAASEYQKGAVDEISRIAGLLSADARERFLKNPAVMNAMGVDTVSRSGLWKVPVQIAPERPATTGSVSFQDLRPVFEVIKKINSELDLRSLTSLILDTMIDFCGAERGTIVVFEGDRFKVQLSRDRQKKELKRVEIGVSRTVLRLVRETGKRVIAEDARQDPSLRIVDSVQDQSLMSILCVPLRVKTRLIGAVYLDNPNRVGAFGSREIEVAELLTDHAAVAIDNSMLHIKSIHDALTSLYNHAHFEKQLEHEVARSRRHGRPCGLLMMDVDDFKGVNDSHGHDAGNEVLKNVARLLSQTLRGDDLVARVEKAGGASPIVARYGGDEFEIILPETSREGVRRAADRALAAVRAHDFRYGEKPLKLSFSVGGAVFPEDAADARALLLKADEALYAAKRAGKNRVVLAEPLGKSPT